MNPPDNTENQAPLQEPPRRVLIADDDPTTLKILQRTLEKSGFEPIPVSSGTDAVAALSGEICAVVLDIQMPGMSGLECLTHIKGTYPDLAPIMLTASDAVSDAVYAMKHGAFDYIVKPFHAQQITSLVERAAHSFEQTIRLRQAEEELRRARQNEINVASRIQQSLLLGRPPEDFPGLEIVLMTVPSQDIDGDFYDFIRQDAETMDLVVADVMGKGIRAAFLGAALKSYFFRVMSETRLSASRRGMLEPEGIVDAVYSHMITPLTELESFVTLFYSRFCPKARRLTYVDCGHVRPLHYHWQSGTVSLLQGENMPLGFPEKSSFRQFSLLFECGDVFLFYSDGLTETAAPDGEMFGEERLIAGLKANADKPAEKLIRALKAEISEFSGSDAFSDDFTCVAVRADVSAIPSELMGRQEITIDSRMAELERVRRFIRNFSKHYLRRASDEPRIAGIELAGVELTTNIIRHAYDNEAGHDIRIEAVAFSREITLAFYDHGKRFDPDLVPEPVLDGSREGGMGVYLVEKSVDEITYSRDEKGENCARMVIRWC